MSTFLKFIISVSFILVIFKTNAQDTSAKETFLSTHAAGFYLGSYIAANEPVMITPQAWIYFNNLYIEARYNYEEAETFSLHAGRSFRFFNDESDIIPAIGLVAGKFNGISTGFNINYESEKFSGFTQTQYCFAFNKEENEPFYFSWLGLSTPVSKCFNIGASWQWLAQKSIDTEFDIGPMVSFTKGKFGVELYAYNPWKKEKYWQAAVYVDFSNN